VKPRLDRYEEFIESEYKAGLRKHEEYSIEFVRPELISMFRNREVKRIVFTGMGCSAIVSDIVRHRTPTRHCRSRTTGSFWSPAKSHATLPREIAHDPAIAEPPRVSYEQPIPRSP
jgi:hypothetical protein